MARLGARERNHLTVQQQLVPPCAAARKLAANHVAAVALLEHVFYLLDRDDAWVVRVPDRAREPYQLGNVSVDQRCHAHIAATCGISQCGPPATLHDTGVGCDAGCGPMLTNAAANGLRPTLSAMLWSFLSRTISWLFTNERIPFYIRV